MAIKESALAAITSITQSDFVRAVTSAGASRRITVANLAKAIVENFTGSSLAGKSQSVKAALDSLNSNYELTNAGTVTVPSASALGWDEVATFNPPSAGLYEVRVTLRFPTNATGARGLALATDSTSVPYVNRQNLSQAINGQPTYVIVMAYVQFTSTSTNLSVRAFQNSGSPLEAALRIDWLKLKS